MSEEFKVTVALDMIWIAVSMAAPIDQALSVLLMQRADPPFKGAWALTGSAMRGDETLDEAAWRTLQERTGYRPGALTPPGDGYYEQLCAVSYPGRDERGPSISVSSIYVQLSPVAALTPGRGVQELGWWPLSDLPALAFDHEQLIRYATQYLKERVDNSPLLFYLLPERFTLTQMCQLYDRLKGREYYHRNLRNQLARQWNLQAQDERVQPEIGRPAREFSYPGPFDQVIKPPRALRQ